MTRTVQLPVEREVYKRRHDHKRAMIIAVGITKALVAYEHGGSAWVPLTELHANWMFTGEMGEVA